MFSVNFKKDCGEEGQDTPVLGSLLRCERVMKVLQERKDFKHNTANIYGRTPLCKADQKEQEDVVELLLEQVDVNPNTADQDREIVPLRAAKKGHEGAAGAAQRQHKHFRRKWDNATWYRGVDRR